MPEMDFAAGSMFFRRRPNYFSGQFPRLRALPFQNDSSLRRLLFRVGLLVVVSTEQTASAIVGGLLALQFLLGVANVAFALPLTIAVLHNTVAAILLLSVLTLLASPANQRYTDEEKSK